jgi:hypothetical protein
VSASWSTTWEAQIHIEAPPTVVYGRIVDVATIGRRSLDCHRATWLDGPAPAKVGSRFRGHNRARLGRWARVCEVIEADGRGSLVPPAYRIEKLPIWPLRWAYGKLMPHHRDMRPHLQYTLEALRAELDAWVLATGNPPQDRGHGRRRETLRGSCRVGLRSPGISGGGTAQREGGFGCLGGSNTELQDSG